MAMKRLSFSLQNIKDSMWSSQNRLGQAGVCLVSNLQTFTAHLWDYERVLQVCSKRLEVVLVDRNPWRSDDFRAPRQQLVWDPGQGVTATSSSWRALAGPFSPTGPPRSRGLRGPRYATVVTGHLWSLLWMLDIVGARFAIAPPCEWKYSIFKNKYDSIRAPYRSCCVDK